MCWCFIHYWIEKCTVKQWKRYKTCHAIYWQKARITSKRHRCLNRLTAGCVLEWVNRQNNLLPQFFHIINIRIYIYIALLIFFPFKSTAHCTSTKISRCNEYFTNLIHCNIKVLDSTQFVKFAPNIRRRNNALSLHRLISQVVSTMDRDKQLNINLWKDVVGNDITF